MFKVGDRIVYTGAYNIRSKRYINKKGTVINVGAEYPGRPEEQVFTIMFDCSPADRSQMYLANLKLANETPDWEI